MLSVGDAQRALKPNRMLQKHGLDIRNGDALESVGKFCYLGDMLNADGGADSVVVVRVKCA